MNFLKSKYILKITELNLTQEVLHLEEEGWVGMGTVPLDYRCFEGVSRRIKVSRKKNTPPVPFPPSLPCTTH